MTVDRDGRETLLRTGGRALVGLLVVANVVLGFLLFRGGDEAPAESTTVGQRSTEPFSTLAPPGSPAVGPSSPATPSPAGPTVAFLGGDYVTGYDGSPPEETFAARSAEALGWQPSLLGDPDFALTADTQTLTEQVAEVIAEEPALAVVVTGVLPADADPDDLAAGTRWTLEALRDGLPGTPIVLVGPFADAIPVPEGAERLRDAARTAAEDVPDVAFVDPVGDEWLRGNGDLEADGVHLTDSAERSYAARFQQVVEERELAPQP